MVGNHFVSDRKPQKCHSSFIISQGVLSQITDAQIRVLYQLHIRNVTNIQSFECTDFRMKKSILCNEEFDNAPTFSSPATHPYEDVR